MILIVGGGIAGLTIGWRLARAGEAVTVLERDSIGQAASRAAAGILFPEPERTAMGELTAVSHTLWPSFVEELEEITGLNLDYRRDGDIYVTFGEDEARLQAKYHKYQTLGWLPQWLTGDEVRQWEPALSPDIAVGLYTPMTHQVDNRLVVQAVAQALVKAGGMVREQTAVAQFLTSSGKIQGVRLQNGDELYADTVILAAGSWSGQLAGLPAECVPPVRPVKGQILAVQTTHPLISRMIRRRDGSLVPRRDGRLLIGVTMEEAGFDPSVTAQAVAQLLQSAERTLPGILQNPLVETVVGFRPGTPDDQPILGQTAVDGLLLATGQYMDGILLAPIMAQALAQLVQTGTTPANIAPFNLDRFQEKS
ncbi:MAG: glycine oxidase ThiO [Ardenticatenaceae bacterium]|nr:glycine oxidase ThiO [Ardenticatenaceae bacterium]